MVLCTVDILHQFNRSPIDFDKSDDDTVAWTVGLDNDVFASQGFVKIINFKSNMGDQLDQVGVWSAFPISLSLNPDWIIFVIRYGYLQMRNINLDSVFLTVC